MGGREVLVQSLFIIIIVAHFINIYHDSAILCVVVSGDIGAPGVMNCFDGGHIAGETVAIWKGSIKLQKAQ